VPGNDARRWATAPDAGRRATAPETVAGEEAAR
jgi:hypothetical protein